MNPFEYDAATSLNEQEILDYYIEDFNYSRFIQSTRNIFLIGERGSGKTMTLLFNAYKLARAYSKANVSERQMIGVYVPCKTPLFDKKEYELVEDEPYRSAILSEHLLALTVAYHIVTALSAFEPELTDELNSALLSDMGYSIGAELRTDKPFLESIELFINRSVAETQKSINAPDETATFRNALSFFSFVMPLINFVKRIPCFKNIHLLLLIDDAHDLNKYQIRALNSWIAYRDHSDFSFKVATAKIRRPEYVTATGGSIIEAHDFLSIDMEQPFQSKFSDFGKLARDIVRKRLDKIGLNVPADEYFPEHPAMARDMEQSRTAVRVEAEKKYPGGSEKQIRDYVYKYGRAHYFRNRASQANLPPYSGFETIVHLSTGVVRNLLYPCYWMYDKALSEVKGTTVNQIEPKIQTEVIKEKSAELWKRVNDQLYNLVDGCSTAQAKQIASLFEKLASLYKRRLSSDISEPRAIAFSISMWTEELRAQIMPLLRIAQEAQILYVREGAAKDDGKREPYYVPNRLLWPNYGLDPVGQHARVSLKAAEIWAAANGREFVFEETRDEAQGHLFPSA